MLFIESVIALLTFRKLSASFPSCPFNCASIFAMLSSASVKTVGYFGKAQGAFFKTFQQCRLCIIHFLVFWNVGVALYNQLCGVGILANSNHQFIRSRKNRHTKIYRLGCIGFWFRRTRLADALCFKAPVTAVETCVSFYPGGSDQLVTAVVNFYNSRILFGFICRIFFRALQKNE